ncbi:MAG TPA: MmgE/PrpD family protein [Burkholderiales bacterium]|nr:MmgE/PrpD family protein [Burkholderiales bacterium]
MTSPAPRGGERKADSLQRFLTNYACGLTYDAISPAAAHQAKVRVIDTLGALIGGFEGESAHMARALAPRDAGKHAATIIGTGSKTTLEMAAFANAIAARSAEMMDIYHFPGSFGGHPSDVVMPVFGAAECSRSSGVDLITAIVLAYEIFLRFSDAFHNVGFDDTNFACIASAAAAARLLGLSREQVGNSIAIAAVANVALKQVRTDELTAWKVIATGHAARAGVFAAMLAEAGAPGPSLPFEGKAGWCAHVAREPVAFDRIGGAGTPFKILDTRIKHRPAAGETISTILAAEKIAPRLQGIDHIKVVTVELYKRALERAGSGEHHWHPRSPDAAGNSIPYLASVALMEGGVTRASFDDAHLANADLSGLMRKVKLVENADFTRAYGKTPVEHRTRITVETNDGAVHVAETGGDADDLSAEKSDSQIEAKFRSLTEPALGPRRASSLLSRLWDLEKLGDVSPLAAELAWQGAR